MVFEWNTSRLTKHWQVTGKNWSARRKTRRTSMSFTKYPTEAGLGLNTYFLGERSATRWWWWWWYEAFKYSLFFLWFSPSYKFLPFFLSISSLFSSHYCVHFCFIAIQTEITRLYPQDDFIGQTTAIVLYICPKAGDSCWKLTLSSSVMKHSYITF